MLARFAKLGIAVVLGLSFSGPLAAQAIGTYSKAAPYEDVKFELSDAIIRRGLVVDHTGQIGTMLERTGPDVGQPSCSIPALNSSPSVRRNSHAR